MPRSHSRKSGPQKDTRTTAEANSKRNMLNRKPYRTKQLKLEAKEKAWKGKDGTWRSPVVTLTHVKEVSRNAF